MRRSRTVYWVACLLLSAMAASHAHAQSTVFAPANQEEFDARYVGKRFIDPEDGDYLEIFPQRRIISSLGQLGRYTYELTDDTSIGIVTLLENDGTRCSVDIKFLSRDHGTYSSRDCWDSGRWGLEDLESASASAAPANAEEFDRRFAWKRIRLPEALGRSSVLVDILPGNRIHTRETSRFGDYSGDGNRRTGRYTYRPTDIANVGTLTLIHYGDSCTLHMTFLSANHGRYSTDCYGGSTWDTENSRGPLTFEDFIRPKGEPKINVPIYYTHLPVGPMTLPEAHGGTGAITYAITPALPTGLSFDPSTRTISGTATETSQRRSYTYTATDTLDESISLTFFIWIEWGIADQSYLAGRTISPLTLPASSGSDRPYSYSLSPALPAGLTFDPATRTLSGTPTEASALKHYTYTATGLSGRSGSLIFNIAVRSGTSAVPNFGSATVLGKEYVAGAAITPLTLPASTGGDAPVSYSLVPALPAGLTFDPATRTLSGTPTAAAEAAIYTYIAMDADGDTASLIYTIAVRSAASAAPSFGSATVPAREYVAGAAIAALTLPAATGGDAPLSYALRPALPAGLTFDPATRTLSGTPTAAAEAGIYTYTAADADGDTASLSFTIAVRSGPTAMLTEREALVALYEATGGAGWTRNDNWLSEEPLGSWHGVSTDSSGRVRALNFYNNGLSGSIPPELGNLLRLEYLRMDENHFAGSIPPELGNLLRLEYLSLSGNRLNGPIPPELGNLSGLERLFLSGNQLSGSIPPELGNLLKLEDLRLNDNHLTGPLPATLGGLTNLFEFSVYGTGLCLPAALNAWHNAIQRKRRVPTCTGEFLTFAATVSAQEYAAYASIAELTLPPATGGDAPVTYGLIPAPPPGLTFDAATRVLSGTPTAAVAATSHTYTATDADGDTASLSFTIAVSSAPLAMPSFGTATIAAQEYVAGEAIAALTLPAATGGDAPVSYALSPPLPAGLIFDAATRVLSGTPTMEAEAASYTYTATDADGETASLTFTIAVGSGPPAMMTDRGALVALYEATGGAGWTRNDNWLSAEPLGSWHGVTTDATGRVTGLNLSNNGLSGSLPSALGGLDGLRSLFLYGNAGLTGALPESSSALTGLRFFYAFGTGLCLPAELNAWYDAIQRKGAVPACTGEEVPIAPTFGDVTIADREYVAGEAIATLTLPPAMGGDAPVTYSLSPALPAGLAFDVATRMLSGTPTAAVAATGYTYTATDADGDAVSLSFTIAVGSGPPAVMTDRGVLVALYEATGGAGWTNGTNWLSAEPLGSWHGVTADAAGRVTGLNLNNNGLSGSLPSALGGLSSLGSLFLYGNADLTGALPESFSALTGLRFFYAFGTGLCLPAALGAWHDAIQRKGTTPACTGEEVPTVPTFGGATVSAQEYVAGEAIAALTLPAATGGDAPVTYGLSPALPAGLIFDAATRTLSGTPTMEAEAVTYTYMATDADGETASLTFTIAVGSGPPAVMTDRGALVALYEATGGAGWIRNDNWLSAEPLGSWHGVTTDASGQVTGLNLSNNGLSGSLPSALGSLGGLRSLFLYGNAGLTGALPGSLSGLTDLQYFYAFGTGLCLPAELNAWHDAIQRKGTTQACVAGEPVPATASALPSVSVADARATEGTGATLAFAVTLSRPATGLVTLDYQTGDGTARAGADYTATSGTLSFAPGETSRTVQVPVLADAHDEGEETMTLSLSNPTGARIGDGEATGTIVNSGALPGAWLARFGRTVADQVMEAVEARMDEPRGPGFEARLGGQRIGEGMAPEEDALRDVEAMDRLEALSRWLRGGEAENDRGFASRSMTERDLLTGSSFALTGGSADGGLAALWGRAAVTRFDGRAGDLPLDGEIASGMLGADWARDRGTLGLVVSHSRGDGAYREPDGGSGAVESVVTGLYPWGRYAVNERVSVWGVVGYGGGTLKLTPRDGSPLETDLDLAMAAAGARGTLLDGGADGVTLRAKADGMAARTSWETVRGPGGNLAGSEASVTRLRFGVEGTRPLRFDGGSVLTPSAEVGVRQDGGDAETGFGADLGAGLAWSDPERGIEAELRGRVLLSHADAGFRERGVAGSLSFDPDPGSDLGVSASLRQSLGGPAGGGADALLGTGLPSGLEPANDDGRDPPRRLEAKLGFGLPLADGHLVGTPQLRIGLSNHTRDYSLGWRLGEARRAGLVLEAELSGTRSQRLAGKRGAEHETGLGIGWRLRGARDRSVGFDLKLEGARRDFANDDRKSEHRVGLNMRARW